MCATLLFGSAAAFAQTGGIKRAVALKADVSVAGREVVVVRAEIEPGVLADRNTHPGDEITYVLEGEAELYIDGEPPRKMKAGDAYILPAGKIHGGKNTGAVTYKVIASLPG